MIFSKNSWHFRFAHEYGGLTDWGDEFRTSLCEYVRRVAAGIFSFSLIAAICSFMLIFNIGGFIALFMHGFNAWPDFGVFFFANMVFLTLIIAFGLVYAASWSKDRKAAATRKAWVAYEAEHPDANYYYWLEFIYMTDKPKNEPSLFIEWFRAKKAKICPIITIK